MKSRGRNEQRASRAGRVVAPSAPGNLAALKDRLTEVIAPVAAAAGYDLERVRVSRIGRRHSVQVVIDGDDGVSLDAIAEVSRSVSTALDAADEAGLAVVPGEYVLEVTSPGVDRPLTEPRHWRRNVGRLVNVAGPGGEQLTARIKDVTEQGVVLDVAGNVRELSYPQLGPGKIQVELRPTAGESELAEFADEDLAEEEFVEDGEGDRK